MLTGDLAEFGAVDLLGLLGSSGTTGALVLEGEGTGVVYCSEGDVTFATTRAGSTLVDVLVAARYLDAADWAEAAATDDPATAVGKALAAKGADPGKLTHALQGRTEEAVFELDLWGAGTFRFESGADHLLSTAFRFPVADLLSAVESRRRRWDDLVDRFGSLEHVVLPPSVVDDRDDDDALLLSRTQVRVLTAAARQVPVRTLVGGLDLGLFGACEVIVGLLDRGLLVVGDVAPANDWSDASSSGITFDRHVVATIEDVVVPATTNGYGNHGDGVGTNGHQPLNGHTNGHTNGNAVGTANGNGDRVAVAPNGAEFIAPGDAPARDLILRLLTAVKEL